MVNVSSSGRSIEMEDEVANNTPGANRPTSKSSLGVDPVEKLGKAWKACQAVGALEISIGGC